MPSMKKRTKSKSVRKLFCSKVNRNMNHYLLVKLLEKRLSWLTFKTKKFNVNEVIAIVSLLKIYKPLKDESGFYNPEEAVKRFWQYCARREEMEERFNDIRNTAK